MKLIFSKDEITNDRRRNFAERIAFIKYWAEYVRKNPDRKWGEGQARLIDSQIISSRRFYAELAKSEKGQEKIEKLKHLKLRANSGI
ncbi:MAG: hypothetical protein KJ905_04115 [Nanoarchaeota archaeon]|nr:hypothetical protein [Nanoarchaeota archaeon]MBU1501925.1 hypothetical protein [Nanoarchaeota archaeon]MBU2459353.1 hypothetical protein [Nanoarchaeota archaeon]